MNFKTLVAAIAIGVGTLATTVIAEAADKKVVVGYQTDALPSSVAIANGEFAKETGYDIDFRRFNSGAEIFAAIRRVISTEETVSAPDGGHLPPLKAAE